MAGSNALTTVTRTMPAGTRASTALASFSTPWCAALPRLSTSRLEFSTDA
jgi:hypothetical protein